MTDIADFARREIASRPGLHQAESFPEDLWRAMVEAGLLGLAQTGAPEDFRTIAETAETLADAGGCKGVAASLLVHLKLARFILLPHAQPGLRAALVPELRAGRASIAMAISEPGAGAHPKHLKTRAERDGDDWLISGEKTYITNGPLATGYCVLAITGEENGRRLFSAFYVPREAEGLTMTPGLMFDFHRPAPHCSLSLERCRVGAENLLGTEGRAFEEISIPFRQAEDLIGAAPLVGAMRNQARMLIGATGEAPEAGFLERLGGLIAAPEALAAIAGAMVDEVVAGRHGGQKAERLSAGFRQCLADHQERVAALAGETGLADDPLYAARTRDIVMSLSIARQARQARLRKVAEHVLQQSGSAR